MLPPVLFSETSRRSCPHRAFNSWDRGSQAPTDPTYRIVIYTVMKSVIKLILSCRECFQGHNPPHPWYTEGRLYYYEFLCLLVDICRPGKWLESYVQQLVCWTIYKWSINLNKLFLAKQPTPRLKSATSTWGCLKSKSVLTWYVKMPSFTGAIYMFIACYKNYFGNLAHEDEDSTV